MDRLLIKLRLKFKDPVENQEYQEVKLPLIKDFFNVTLSSLVYKLTFS